jgi:hypothetical protein
VECVNIFSSLSHTLTLTNTLFLSISLSPLHTHTLSLLDISHQKRLADELEARRHAEEQAKALNLRMAEEKEALEQQARDLASEMERQSAEKEAAIADFQVYTCVRVCGCCVRTRACVNTYELHTRLCIPVYYPEHTHMYLHIPTHTHHFLHPFPRVPHITPPTLPPVRRTSRQRTRKS